ncbi:16S rRNA (cytidine(1402)-2'-O)-methyltransferase [Candidatus Microgenomates bacterium]|nr:16S rRNA (cytidine(1402)-2'-O)-methyltransferase [Candidatus Microgenomates bacterium]
MLSIVGTPIGNLSDLSIRQAETLAAAEYIVTEDTRSTGMLLNKIKELFPNLRYETTPQLISYYKDNEFEKLPQILELVRSGSHIALTSQAGMPLVSDPGFLLVKHLIKEGLHFEVIPGPTAIATALVHSGFNPGHHMFVGFFPKKPKDIMKLIGKLKQMAEIEKDLVFVAYESPNRINSTLEVFAEIIPTADIAITRELTKKFEEVVRGKPDELAKREYKGEITMVLKFA